MPHPPPLDHPQAFCPLIAQNLGLSPGLSPGQSPGQALSFPCPASLPGLVLRSLNQVPLQASVSAIPRSAAADGASPGPVATPARATPVSGSVRRAHTASTWTNVAAFPRLVLPGAAKTRQAASVACAGQASAPARGVRSVWTWTSATACRHRVTVGAVRTRQAASCACAPRGTRLHRTEPAARM